jgi:hypothetical protein
MILSKVSKLKPLVDCSNLDTTCQKERMIHDLHYLHTARIEIIEYCVRKKYICVLSMASRFSLIFVVKITYSLLL